MEHRVALDNFDAASLIRSGSSITDAGSACGAATVTKQGRSAPRFRGRFGGRKLAPGAYRLVLLAVDAANNRSAPKRAAFRIVR